MPHEKICEAGMLFLLIYLPWAYGGVTEYSHVILSVVVGALFALWALHEMRRPRITHERGASSPRRRYVIRLALLPGTPVLLMFFGLIGGQIIPLPVRIVEYLSPNTHQLHAEAAAVFRAALPPDMPLSVCPQATQQEFMLLLAYALTAFLLINTIREARQVRRFTHVIIALGALEAAFGLLQSFSRHQFFSLYQPSPFARGSFISKNHFAGYLDMVIPLTLGLALAGMATRATDSSAHGARIAREHRAKNALLFAAFGLMLCAQLLSGSRGGIISAAGGLLCFALMVSRKKLLRRKLRVILILLAATLLAVMLLIPDQFFATLTRFKEQPFESSFGVRWAIWRGQAQMIRDYPLFGAGFGALAHLMRRYQQVLFAQLAYSESDVMQLIVETGLIGAGLAGGLAWIFFKDTLAHWQARRSRRISALAAGQISALISLLLHGFVDFNFRIPSNAFLFAVIAAFAFVTVRLSEET